MSYSVPILFITFNRLDTSRQVFEAIKRQQPEKLYLFSDGPRKEKSEEAKAVHEVRTWLTSQINWPCEVQTLFLDHNMGPRYAIGHAVNWLFEHEEEGVIFEHDCLPHPSFFPFCEELLERYKNEHRVMHISGNNYLFGRIQHNTSYYFSKHNISWGWATWKRAWKFYDADMQEYKARGEELINVLSKRKRVRAYWTNILNRVYTGQISTWDFQWTFNMWCNHGFAIVPEKNLVKNIGYGDQAIHTGNSKDKLARLPLYAMEFPMSHPKTIQPDEFADDYYIENIIYPVFFLRLRFVQQLLQRIGFYRMK